MTSDQQQPSSSLDNYRDMLNERGELAVLKKQVEDRIKQLDEDLRPALEGRGETVVGKYSFKCVLSKGRTSIDKDSLGDFLKSHGTSIAAFEKEGAPFTTMTVKEVNVI
jgi:hypothetical protein